MIYFAQDASTNIKIGYTSSQAELRVKAIRTGSSSPVTLLATIQGDKGEESRLHAMFASARVCGEWFRPVPELLKYIMGITDKADVSLPAWPGFLSGIMPLNGKYRICCPHCNSDAIKRCGLNPEDEMLFSCANCHWWRLCIEVSDGTAVIFSRPEL